MVAFTLALAFTLSIVSGAGLSVARAGGVTLTVSCFASPVIAAACRSGVDAWAAATGNHVELFFQPEDTTALLATDRMLLEAKSPDLDIVQIDVVWPGLLAEHFVDLLPHVPADEINRHFPALIANNTVDGRLVALPWFSDVGLLYYRADLLERHGLPVPQTWDELEITAARVLEEELTTGNGDLVGFIWQGRAYEGLTCNALEWMASFGGGTIVDDEGSVVVDNSDAIRALDQAAAWLGSITPWSVLFFGEAESRDMFRNGHVLFMRNWPFAWYDINGPGSPVAGRVGVAPLPRGSAGPGGAASGGSEWVAPRSAPRSVGALGGWQLAVSRYSRHIPEAIDLVRFLTSAAEQKRRAIGWSYSPTIPSLFEDTEVLAAMPFFSKLLPILKSGIVRPARLTGRHYEEVSRQVWSAVYATLSGNGGAAANLGALARTLENMKGAGRW